MMPLPDAEARTIAARHLLIDCRKANHLAQECRTRLLAVTGDDDEVRTCLREQADELEAEAKAMRAVALWLQNA